MTINTAINNLNKDAATWQFIGDVKEKQKIEIDLDKEGQTSDLRVSKGHAGDTSQGVSRSFIKLFGTIAAAEPTITWIDSSLLKTRHDLIKLAQAFEAQGNITNPKVLESSLKALKNLKEQLQGVPLGLENLKDTYEGRVTEKGESIPGLISKEQEYITAQLSKNISNLIVDLGEKLQQAMLHEPVALTAVEAVKKELKSVKAERDAVVGRSFAVLAEEDLNERVKDYLTDPFESKAGMQVARELVQGKQNDIELKTLKTAKGSAQMPGQFSLDLPRMISLKLNDEEIYSRLKTFQYDPIEAYQKLCEAFGDTKGELIGRRVASLVSQAYLADITRDVRNAINKDSPNYINPGASDQYYEIEVAGDKVLITIKICFDLVEPATRRNPERNHGAVIVRRDIEIPIRDLRVKDLETRPDPLPNIRVTDMYSKCIQSGAYAEELMKVF